MVVAEILTKHSVFLHTHFLKLQCKAIDFTRRYNNYLKSNCAEINPQSYNVTGAKC